MANYMQQFAQKLQELGNKPDPAQAQLEAELTREQAPNQFRGTISTIDSLTGSNFAGQLPKEESRKERLAQLLQLRQGVENQKLSGLGKLAQMEASQADKAMQRAFQEKMYGLQLLKAKSKLAGSGGGRKLGSEDIKAINNIDSMMADIPKLKAALQRGESLHMDLPIIGSIGDNEATAVRRRLKEWFGRNQSGGAIGDEEGKEFYNIISGLTDSDETRMAKLDNLYNDVKRRRDAFYYGPTAQPNIDSQMAGPGPASEGSSEDDEAFAWAAQNPNDPRAQMILQHVGKR